MKRGRTVAERMAEIPPDDGYAGWRGSAKGQYFMRQLEQNAYKKGFTGRKEKAPPPQAPILANSLAKGYGYSDVWPFDPKKAFSHQGYRAGIERALKNPAFAENWKVAARSWLEDIYFYEQQLRDTYADVIAQQLQQDFSPEDLFSEEQSDEQSDE